MYSIHFYKVKIVSDALPWEQAQQRCAADFGSLITINSAEVLQSIKQCDKS